MYSHKLNCKNTITNPCENAKKETFYLFFRVFSSQSDLSLNHSGKSILKCNILLSYSWLGSNVYEV